MAPYPDDKIVVILLTNIAITPFANITSKLVELAFGEVAAPSIEHKPIAGIGCLSPQTQSGDPNPLTLK